MKIGYKSSVAMLAMSFALFASPTLSERKPCKVGDDACVKRSKTPFIHMSAELYARTTAGSFEVAGQRSVQHDNGEIRLTRLIFYPESESRDCNAVLGSSYEFYVRGGAYVPNHGERNEADNEEDPYSSWKRRLQELNGSSDEAELADYLQLETVVSRRIENAESSSVDAVTLPVRVKPYLDFDPLRESLVPVFENARYVLLHHSCLSALDGSLFTFGFDIYPAEWFESVMSEDSREGN